MYNINDVLQDEAGAFDVFDEIALMPVIDVDDDSPTPFIGPFKFADHDVVINVDGKSYRVTRAYMIDDHVHMIVHPETT